MYTAVADKTLLLAIIVVLICSVRLTAVERTVQSRIVQSFIAFVMQFATNPCLICVLDRSAILAHSRLGINVGKKST